MPLLKILAASFSLGLPGAAAAQEKSDLNPPAPTAPAGGGGAWAPGWYPGMPQPVAAPAPAQAPASASRRTAEPGAGQGEAIYGTAASGNGGSGKGDESAFEDWQGGQGGQNGQNDAVGMPESHRVQKGDTLWGLSSTYYNSPWFWPKLWSWNPLITNPHWIYPGDVVRLRPASGQPLPVAAPAFASNAPVTLDVGHRVAGNLGLRQTGFVEQGDLKTSAQITGSREEKVLLSNLDEVYLEYHRRQPLKPGERYSIYHVVSDVKRPGTKVVIGSIVEVVGELEVRSLAEKQIAKAVITEAINPIERGFRVGPLRRRFALVEPVPSRVNVDAIVVATLRQDQLVPESTIVFLDRGQDDGLVVGNRLPVIRQGDGSVALLSLKPKGDDRFPREVFGEVMVVEVRGQTSTAVLSRSTREVNVGDPVQARKGY